MRIENRSAVMLAATITLSFLVISCSTTRETARTQAPVTAQKQITRSPIVTLQKKPDWLLLGGIDVTDSRGGDIIWIRGKTLSLPGWVFSFENDDPSTDPLIITPFSGNRIVYWKGKGAIINTSTGERVVLPLPPSEDPRSDAERNSFFEKNILPRQ